MSGQSKTPDRERLAALARDLRSARPNLPAGRFADRGIVIAAGGALMFTNAYVLVRVLRETLGSRLPIEIWHFGGEEMSPAMAALLAPYDVELVDALPRIAVQGARVRDGWQLKSFALLWSRFAEVLLLDADQVPVSDPAQIFDWPQYRDSGAVFWPDIVDLRPDNAVWSMLGLPGRRAVSLESGQLLVDKRRHWPALSAALRLNEASDDLYQLVYGDKDTFLLAWELTESAYALVPHRPFVDEFALTQRDFDGQRLFQHRTNAKWLLSGIQVPVAGFVHEAACLAALEDLGNLWGGRVFTAPDRTARARSREDQMIALGSHQLVVADEPTHMVRFGNFAELPDGRAGDRRHWWVEEIDDRFRLVLGDGDRRTYVFDRQDGETWLGRRLRRPETEALLRSTASCAQLEPTGIAAVPGLIDDLLRGFDLRAAGTDELEEFGAALGLLASVLPGAGARLEHLASQSREPLVAERLRHLAERLAAPASQRQDVDRTDVFRQGYLPAGSYE